MKRTMWVQNLVRTEIDLFQWSRVDRQTPGSNVGAHAPRARVQVHPG